MARNLIGTGADQVSVNGMLGELAFQTKENVNFTGGTGKLSKLDIDAISAQLGITAVDVFVYDTSKDSDGGAWRNRCAHTSWYNEQLNTIVRGKRKQFPSVAVIAITTNSMIIYDGDDSELSMWLIAFSNGSYLGWTGKTSVTALNGTIYTTSNNGSGNGELFAYSFIEDTVYQYGSTGKWYKNSGKSIAERQIAGSGAVFVNSYGLLSNAMNDVAVTVLQNSPIDVATGLPVPTIVVGTPNGVSVIKSDNTIIGWCSGAPMKRLSLKDGYMHIIYSGNGRLYIDKTPSSNVSYGSISSGVVRHFRAYGVNEAYGADGNSGFFLSSPNEVATASSPIKNGTAIGTSVGLTTSHEQYDNAIGAAMLSYANSKFNSGYVIGDVRGAWLADSTAESIVGGVNRLSSTNFTGWTAGGGWSISSGVASHVSGNAGYLSIAAPTVTNRAYTLKITGTFSAAGSILLANHTFGNGNVTIPVTATTGTFYVSWTQGTYNTGSLVLYTGSLTTITAIELYDADADRSHYSQYGNGLQVNGTVSKTPVAAGAELVGYSSGSSTSNYLYHPFNSSLNIGTGDLSITCWVKMDTIVNGIWSYLFMKESSENYMTLNIHPADANYGGEILFKLGSANWALTDYSIVGKGWVNLCLVRRSGVSTLYANGNPVFTTTTHNGSVDATSGGTFVRPIGCDMALLRVSASAPSPQQIMKMYNDEKQLFQENAKCTLYGTSDAVTALAYDEDTQLLHAGTSAGRSVFLGLRRIDNTTTAVSATISAANGLVAEQ